MRIGILTYHAAHNYGAVLQAIGTQEQLHRFGHKPVFIHSYPQLLENSNRKRRPVHNLRSAAYALGYSIARKSLEQRYFNFTQFCDKNYKTTRRYLTYEDLIEDPPDVDAYVCGSDQIWKFDTGMSPEFFLRFADTSIPAIAYAPSFGHVATEVPHPAELSDWISRFQHLSVREASGQNLIFSLTGRMAPLVMDPAFFLTADEWGRFAVPARQIDGDYILFYSLEFNKLISHTIRTLAKRTGLRVVVVGKAGIVAFNPRTRLAIDAGPDEFLSLIKGASLVVTNSFHATVFSLIFNRPFVTVRHSARNERIENVLTLASASSRLAMSHDDVSRLSQGDLFADPGDPTNGVLVEPIRKSRDFLGSALQQIM